MKKHVILIVALFLPTFAFANPVTITVGKVKVDGVTEGLSYISKIDGSNFLGCSVDPDRMYLNTSFSPEKREAFLAFFLTAKSTGAQVMIWFAAGSDNRCRMSDAEMQ